MREQFKCWEEIDVRWGDMDALGHVNNAQYFVYCESARMRYFELIDLLSFRTRDRQGPGLVTASCHFKQQVHYPAALDVGARVVEIRNRSFTLAYEIFRRGSDDLVAEGTSVVAWVDYAEGRAVPLPDALKKRICEFESAGDLAAGSVLIDGGRLK